MWGVCLPPEGLPEYPGTCWVLNSKSKATIFLWHLAKLEIMEDKRVISPSFIHFIH